MSSNAPLILFQLKKKYWFVVYLQRYMLDQCQLPDEPPRDRVCRICSFVGHFAESCPRNRRNKMAAAKQYKEQQNQSVDENGRRPSTSSSDRHSAGPSRTSRPPLVVTNKSLRAIVGFVLSWQNRQKPFNLFVLQARAKTRRAAGERLVARRATVVEDVDRERQIGQPQGTSPAKERRAKDVARVVDQGQRRRRRAHGECAGWRFRQRRRLLPACRSAVAAYAFDAPRRRTKPWRFAGVRETTARLRPKGAARVCSAISADAGFLQ